ncbi:hypothetical protein BJV77DRAFT_299437 [Russula vinacea]|nr:hypothetical protein BJV77DRAFT_299437 [Russula vinacea]
MGRLVHLLFPHITHPQPDVPLLRDTEPLTEPMKSHIGPNVLSQEPKMDRFSLTNHFDLDKLDKTYRNQAKNLIAICQTFVYTQEQALHSYDELRRYRQIISILISLVNCCKSICQVVDGALMSANEAQMKSSKFIGKKFKKAIDVLSDYERSAIQRRRSLKGQK